MIQIAMKRWSLLVVACFLMSAAAFAGVSVSSPSPGATTSSPVHFAAFASSSAPITAMRIYVDDVSVFLTFSNQLDTLVPMSLGTHSVVVQAWDSTGAWFKAPETITVSSAPGNVNVSSPANNATVASPFQVIASASASNPITALQIYLDGQLVFTNNAASLNTNVSASTGSHSLVVQAWDSSGAFYKQPLTITVSSSVPPYAIVQSEIQNMGGWENCTMCAGAGGNGSPAGFSVQQFQSSPSLSGSSAQFNIWGSTPYSDVLWWKQLGGNNGIANFKYDLDFYITAPQFAQALEFDVNQSNGYTKFIFGTQCNIRNGGVWDVWDTAGGVWRHTGVACTMPSAYTWHHLTWEVYRDATAAHFVAVTLDGVKHYVNMSFYSKAQGGTELNVAFQLDGDYAQHDYSAWLNFLTLHYW